MEPNQELTFWDIIETFHNQGLLQHVMLIGSWAEYIYQHFYIPDFRASLRTRDVDFLYMNLRRPGHKIEISQALKDKGFQYTEDRVSGVGKYVKDDLTIEFLVRVLGKGDPAHSKIPSIGVTGIGLRETNMLTNYPIKVECKSYTITIPEPEVYVLQKLLINPKRSEEKREKDMASIKVLLRYIDMNRLKEILNSLSKKQQKVIYEVCEINTLSMP